MYSGSYDAAKYNVDNDYTKSESANGKYNDRQPGLGYRQEFDTDASGTFISQKNQAFGSSNFNGKFSPTSQEPLKDTNTPQKNIESFSKNEPNKKLESVSLQRTAIEGRLQILPNISFASKGDNLNKNTDKKELSDDENYARPIFLPSLQITQASNNFFGTKNSYLPPGNQALESHQHLKPAINAYNHLPITSNENRNQPQKNENILIPNNLPSNTFLELSETSVNNGELDLSKQKSLQSSSKNNIQTNYRPGSTLKQSYSNINLFNNQQPTLQPQTDLTTPFEHDPSSNKSNTFSDQQFNPFQLNAASNGLLQQGPNTNQHPTFSQQSYNVGQIVSEYGKPNEGSTNNGKFQTSSTSQHSQTQGSDNSYYYNRPSKPFNVPNENKVTLSTFGSKSNNVPIKQFFVNDYEGSQDRSKVGPLALKPATPVQKDVIHPQFQYNGITQASATSFTSINNKNDNIRTEHSNLQIANNVGQLAKYPSSTFQSENAFSQQSIAIQQPFPQQSGINKGDLSNIQISHYDNSYKTAEHMPSQQFGTEIYEYKKPTEILPISSQTSDIRHPNSQFGDKLKPSAFKTQSSSIPGVGFLNRPNGLQSDFNSNSNSHEFESSRPQTTQNQSVESYQHYINTNRDQGLEENTKNQSFGQFDSQVTKQTHQSAPFTPSFSSLNRKRPDFKQQFSSSSAFRPCCQESTTSNDKFTKQDADNFGLSSPSDVFSENKQITHAKNEFASSNVFRPSCRESTSLNCQTTQKDIIRPDVQIGPIDNRQVTHKHQFKGSSVLRPCCQSITSNSQINEQNSGFQNNQNQQEPISTGNTQIGFQGINTELGLNNQTPLDTLSANFQSHQSFASVQTTSQSFTGAREEFSGPRKPPSFDKSTGYHY